MRKNSTILQLNYMVVVDVTKMVGDEKRNSPYFSRTLIQQHYTDLFPFEQPRNYLKGSCTLSDCKTCNSKTGRKEKTPFHKNPHRQSSTKDSIVSYYVASTIVGKELECISSTPASLGAAQRTSFYLTCLRELTRPGI